MGRPSRFPRGAGSWLRRHALFLAALLLGVTIRAVVVYAYRPALLFTDSSSYLRHAEDGTLAPLRPVGYSFVLRPFLALENTLTAVQLVQHALGLLLAVACYAFLLRRGLPAWGATLAVLPLLLDPLQLVLEHYILSDVLFEALLVAACLVLLWRHRPSLAAVVAAGLLVSSSALVRGAGTFLILAFVVAVVCLRVGWVKVVAFLVSAVLPMGLYTVAFHEEHGEYAVSLAGPRFLYARVAPIVHCQDPQLDLPSYERILCPREPIAERPSTDFYMWGHPDSPRFRVVPPEGMTRDEVLKDFDKRVVRAQPVGYTKAVLKDFAGGFAPTRTYDVPGYPSSYWLFADHYWSLDTFIERGMSPDRLEGTSHDPAAAQFMTTYRAWVYLPGPLAALLLLVAGAAALGLGRARLSGDRVAVGLLAGCCALTLLTGAALSGFSWRYQLPQIPLLPMAGALGFAALARGRPAGRPQTAPPLRLLDRIAQPLTRIPAPASWRPGIQAAVDHGWVQVLIALLVGVSVAAVVRIAAVGSGWFLPTSAALAGAGLGALTAAGLLVARVRSGPCSPPESVPVGEPAPQEPTERAGVGR